ncbi:Hydroxymethylpyrimidine/phosphomethylpyrimidine kinase [Gammaproteobacteria bacterium]
MFPPSELSENRTPPVVLSFSGQDATGGAGIAADIATLLNLGCHPCAVVTAIAVQDTVNVKHCTAISAYLVTEQAQAILEDMQVAAIKIGLIGSEENAEAIASLLQQCPGIPVVLDPILWAGGGTALAGHLLKNKIFERLLPLVTVLTPNVREARALVPSEKTLEACALRLLGQGCYYVLATGADEATEQVSNILYAQDQKTKQYLWQRLPHVYHGSGCTLAAAVAGFLALNLNPAQAIQEAQSFTWEALRRGYALGRGQHLPMRFV